MKVYIIIPYRPTSQGGLQSIPGELRQLPDGKWIDSEGKIHEVGECRYGQDEMIRAIRFINKNSHYRHHIVMVVDGDVFPDPNYYYKEADNITILQSKYVHNGPLSTLAISRLNAAYLHGINNIADDEWLCYGYISDLICPKGWDKPIIDSIKQLGENYVYVPMFTEVKGGMADKIFIGTQPTPKMIWEDLRKLCSYSLTMPEPACRYFTEADISNFIEVSRQYPRPNVIIERPGDRIYGYYAVMFMKAKYAKKAMMFQPTGQAFDLAFDNRLYTDCGLMKVVVTHSYVFHPFCEFRY